MGSSRRQHNTHTPLRASERCTRGKKKKKMASMRVAVSRQAAVRRTAVSCHATRKETPAVHRRQLFSLLAGTVGLVALGERAEAVPTVEEMLERSQANKELNDKKRAATSGANLARSRTVTDGTCAFPNNLIGCENLAELGDVKFLSDASRSSAREPQTARPAGPR